MHGIDKLTVTRGTTEVLPIELLRQTHTVVLEPPRIHQQHGAVVTKVDSVLARMGMPRRALKIVFPARCICKTRQQKTVHGKRGEGGEGDTEKLVKTN